MAHTYIIGHSGSGKTTLLFQLILKDISAGRGVLYITPHAEDADKLLSFIPEQRAKDVIIIDPTDEKPCTFSPLYKSTNIPFTAQSIVDSIKDAWDYSGATPTMDMYLYNTTYAVLEAGGPFLGVLYMLLSPIYRTRVFNEINDPVVRAFWDDFETLNPKDKRDTTRSTLNKLMALFSDYRMRHFFASSSFTMSDILKDNKIVICRLPMGELGTAKVRLIGSLLLTQLHLASLGGLCTFSIFLDEFHHFAGQTLNEMLSGSRKYGIELTLAHQYLEQLPKKSRASALGNCSTKYVFRVTTDDARYLNDQLKENQMLFSLETMPRYTARLVRDGLIEDVSLTNDLPPPNEAIAEKICQTSRRYYGKKRDKLEASVQNFLKHV